MGREEGLVKGHMHPPPLSYLLPSTLTSPCCPESRIGDRYAARFKSMRRVVPEMAGCKEVAGRASQCCTKTGDSDS